MKTWLFVDQGSDFSIHNLPFGIFRVQGGRSGVCSRLGDMIIDLAGMAELGYFDDLGFETDVFSRPVLNDFISLGKAVTCKVRTRIQEVFLEENARNSTPVFSEKVLVDASKAEMLLPLRIGDYTDFYSSIEHATNVGMMFRDPANALLPNWRHLPVGYHGRASSILVSGVEVSRPWGQIKPPDAQQPLFSATRQLDFELETAFVIGKPNELGEAISTSQAEDHIFGMVLFNDLSARDIQNWEYVPLGPFLSKNFASVISPWVVTLDALEPFRVAGPVQEPEVLPYLQFKGERSFDINLEVSVEAQNNSSAVVCRSNFRHLYWNMSQQLAHHTVNGCNMRTGDLCASGTISGPEPGSYGSMLEITWRGTRPIRLADGPERKFLEDFDTVIMRGFAEKSGIRVGFGEARVRILPARE